MCFDLFRHSRISLACDVLGCEISENRWERKLTCYRYDEMERLLEVRQYLGQLLTDDDNKFDIDPGDSVVDPENGKIVPSALRV